MEQDKLLQRFEQEFDSMKKELGFSATLDDLDSVFFVRDYAIQLGYVSPTLSRMICRRIAETLNSWISYLHNLILPNPSSMVNVAEHKLFDEKDKNKISKTIHEFLSLTSENAYIGLTKDRKLEAEYIDNSLVVWKKNLEFLISIVKRVNEYWETPPKEQGL